MRKQKHLQRLPTGFSFGILVIPSKIPPSFGIPFVCCELALVGGGGLDGAFEFDVLLLLLLLPLAFAMRPAPTGTLLSIVVVFFSFAPFWMLCNNADLLSGPPEMPALVMNEINILKICRMQAILVIRITYPEAMRLIWDFRWVAVEDRVVLVVVAE